MSCLKLYWPQTATFSLALYPPADADWHDDAIDGDATGDDAAGDGDAPVILSFPGATSRMASGPQQELLSRARLLHQNRRCPICSGAAVVPVNAEPALMTRNHMPTPGNGAIVGFACDACGHSWDASR